MINGLFFSKYGVPLKLWRHNDDVLLLETSSVTSDEGCWLRLDLGSWSSGWPLQHFEQDFGAGKRVKVHLLYEDSQVINCSSTLTKALFFKWVPAKL